MNIIKLENLSSCDFDCNSGKVRVKASSNTIDSTSQNIPNPYNSIVGTPPTNLKEGAVVVEVFNDGIGFWKQTSCDTTSYTFQKTAIYRNNYNVIVDAQSSSYTLQLGDEGKYIRISSVTPVDVIVPTDTLVPFPVGTVITITQAGLGTITIDAVQPTPILFYAYNNGFSTAGQYAVIQLIKIDVDKWDVIGGV